jgi:hypothetical protein
MMQGWEEVAAYYQRFAHDPQYAMFSHDMLIAVEALRIAPAFMLISREVAEGMIVFALPNATRQPALGWFKPGVYSAVTRNPLGKLFDAQLVTLNGVVSGLQGLIERLPYTAVDVNLPVSR